MRPPRTNAAWRQCGARASRRAERGSGDALPGRGQRLLGARPVDTAKPYRRPGWQGSMTRRARRHRRRTSRVGPSVSTYRHGVPLRVASPLAARPPYSWDQKSSRPGDTWPRTSGALRDRRLRRRRQRRSPRRHVPVELPGPGDVNSPGVMQQFRAPAILACRRPTRGAPCHGVLWRRRRARRGRRPPRRSMTAPKPSQLVADRLSDVPRGTRLLVYAARETTARPGGPWPTA